MLPVALVATLLLAAPAAYLAAPALKEAACDVYAIGLLPQHDVSLAPCQGIRPGGALILRAGPFELVYCTLSFIVTDGQDLYIATAGHCVED